MNDRELLELAAKAADYWIVGPAEKYIAQLGHYEGGFVIRNERGGNSCWNPLTDDGDALRLAIKLRLGLVHGWESFEEKPLATVWISHDGKCLSEEIKRDDPYAATRRAIVRAAAEIGKNV